MSPAYIQMYLRILFIMEANIMNPDQPGPKGMKKDVTFVICFNRDMGLKSIMVV